MKIGYLDERTGELSIIVVAEIDTLFTLSAWTLLLFKLLLLKHSFQHNWSEISKVMDWRNMRLICHALITGGRWPVLYYLHALRYEG